jgi:hypothetical protein
MWHVWRRVVYRVLVGKSEGIGALERPRRRWQNNVIMDFKKKYNEKAWTGLMWLKIR